jgi:hypothetical protein
MKALFLQVAMLSLATGDITGHRHRGVVIVQPPHMAPGSLPPDKIVDPEKWLDEEWSQWYRCPL